MGMGGRREILTWAGRRKGVPSSDEKGEKKEEQAGNQVMQARHLFRGAAFDQAKRKKELPLRRRTNIRDGESIQDPPLKEGEGKRRNWKEVGNREAGGKSLSSLSSRGRKKKC